MGETGENHRPAASHWQTLSHNGVSSIPYHDQDSNSQLWWWHALIAYIGSCNSNYHTNTTTTAPVNYIKYVNPHLLSVTDHFSWAKNWLNGVQWYFLYLIFSLFFTSGFSCRPLLYLNAITLLNAIILLNAILLLKNC